MKAFLLILAVLSTPSPAATLKLDCQFADPEIKDHVLIELLSDQRGTFSYDTKDIDPTNPPEKIEIRRVASHQNDIAKWQVVRPEVQLFFLMPSQFVSRASDQFTSNLLTEIPELNLSTKQEMKCSSKF